MEATMKIKLLTFGLLLLSMVFLACLAEDEDDPFGSGGGSSDLRFQNVQANHQKPSKVQFIFSLRDRRDHAVLIPQADFVDQVNIIIEEDNLPIDYTESHGFVHTAESFGMDLVLVLDYTASMAQNNGIDTMLQGVDLILNSLAASHRVAIVEFHDNNPGDDYSVLQEFTSNKQEAGRAAREFSNVYNGFSSCWDAVYRGLELFPEDSNSSTFRALVFLSDGFDNSSSNQPQDLIDFAEDIGVTIFNIGVGENITDYNESNLERISFETGGKYHRANNLGELQERFVDIVNDLGGNYKISYITPKRGSFEVKIRLEYNGRRTEQPIIQNVNGAAIFDSDRKGILAIDQPLRHGDRADIFIAAEHLPREISQFRFRMDLPDSVKLDGPIEIISPSDGGLLNAEWSDVTVDQEGYFSTSGPELSFGDFGVLFRISLKDLPENTITIPILFDNSVYSNGVMFYGGDPSEIDSDGNWETMVVIE